MLRSIGKQSGSQSWRRTSCRDVLSYSICMYLHLIRQHVVLASLQNNNNNCCQRPNFITANSAMDISLVLAVVNEGSHVTATEQN